MVSVPGTRPKNSFRPARPSTKRLVIEYRRLSELKLNPENPRVHSDKQIRQIARSLEVFGPIMPVVIDKNSKVIAGNGRIQAARLLGLPEFPATCADHLTEAQATAFAIADNRLTDNSMWDERLLAEQLKALSEVELDFSLEVTGFEVTEIDLMIDGTAPVVEGENDPADVLPPATENKVPVSRKGDLWLLGRHRILCGTSLDASDYSVLMGNRRAAMVFTDPPYNVRIEGHAGGLGAIQHKNFGMACGELGEGQYTDYLGCTFDHLARHTVDGSLHYVFMDWRHLSEILTAGEQAYTELKAVCIWVKDNGGMGSLYRSQHELIFVFKNGKESHRNNVQLGQYGRYRTNVWKYPGVNSFSRTTDEDNLLEFHPTVKPVALVADAIMDVSARGDIVLDPFLGSGTTVIAAERTGRVCYGIELYPQYVDPTIQ